MLPAAGMCLVRSHCGHLASQVPHCGPGPEAHHVRCECVESARLLSVERMFDVDCSVISRISRFQQQACPVIKVTARQEGSTCNFPGRSPSSNCSTSPQRRLGMVNCWNLSLLYLNHYVFSFLSMMISYYSF